MLHRAAPLRAAARRAGRIARVRVCAPAAGRAVAAPRRGVASAQRDMASHFSLKPDPKEHPLSEKPSESDTGYSLEEDLSRLVRQGRWKDVVRVFELFKDTELPSLRAYNLALQGYGRTKKRMQMESTLREMKQRGVAPNARTYRTMLQGFAALHYPKQLKAYFADMRAKGFEVDTRAYNIVLSGFSRMARRDDLLAMYQQMLADKVDPDIRTFTHLLKGFKKFGTQQDVLAVEDERDERGIEIDDVYHSTLVSAFEGTDLEKADRFLGEN